MTIFNSKGRIRRIEYILQKGISILLLIAMVLIIGLVKESLASTALDSILVLGTFGFFVYTNVVSSIKRLHDLDKPGSMYFLSLVPIYNIVFMLGLLFEKGTYGTNRYGNDPRFEGKAMFWGKLRNHLLILAASVFLVWSLKDIAEYYRNKEFNQVLGYPVVGDLIVCKEDGDGEYKYRLLKISSANNDSVCFQIGSYLYTSSSDALRAYAEETSIESDLFYGISTVAVSQYKELDIVDVER